VQRRRRRRRRRRFKIDRVLVHNNPPASGMGSTGRPSM